MAVTQLMNLTLRRVTNPQPNNTTAHTTDYVPWLKEGNTSRSQSYDSEKPSFIHSSSISSFSLFITIFSFNIKLFLHTVLLLQSFTFKDTKMKTFFLVSALPLVLSQLSTEPTRAPSPSPFSSARPSRSPIEPPSVRPTYSPVRQPSAAPLPFPTATPTISPSGSKSDEPTILPSESQSNKSRPSRMPIEPPSDQPSFAPFRPPSAAPSAAPLPFPTATPTILPSGFKSNKPSIVPTKQLLQAPSLIPTSPSEATKSINPSSLPSLSPTTKQSSAPSFVCKDSPFKNKIDCNDYAQKPTSCDKKVNSHCPLTCSNCSECIDSKIKFQLEPNDNGRKAKTMKCKEVAKKKDEYCNLPGVSDTCRKSCGKCN